MTAPLVLLTAARELPPGDDWLGPAEQAILRGLRWPERRRDFRLGRLAAKRALALVAGCDGALARRRFEVRPAPGGVPQAFRDEAPLAVALSLSHSHGWASAAVLRGTGPLGCDLERIEARGPAFLDAYLTWSEREFVGKGGAESERPLRATLVWSAKEAVMKALGEGLRLAPASVEVLPATGPVSEAGWRRFSVSAPSTAPGLQGFWRAVGEVVLTVAGGSDEPRFAGSVSPECRSRLSQLRNQ
jgi:4'-phosphopantetheinyl transferase